ncbi:polyprenyl synthetase family protein [Lentzea tibetensis]|uniref:Polyprenyl synthetase family protein n=1 Tax=Lentzea tibetensis TaxID=2591470 RepID=A0A563EJK8_9PSEU|nr:polyprenyl synthetase family protein [Lentzea tibetensis]
MATDVLNAPRSAHDVLEWSRQTVTPRLQSAVATLPTTTRRIAGYQFGWSDARERTSALRSALTMLSASAVGGTPEQALAAAAAVELAHQHCQLHDDVTDGVRTRRDRATAWTVFGAEPALEAADALLAQAFTVLAGSGHPSAVLGVRMLNTAMLAVVDGQIEDLALDAPRPPDLATSVRNAASTAGALMGCACAMGAVFGGGSQAQIEHLRVFGAHVGLVFQHVEDLIGIWGSPLHADLHRRRMSLPVVAAMTSGTAEGRELAELYSGDEPLSDAEAHRAAELVDLAGGRTWSLREVDSLLVQALRRLRSAQPGATAADELFALAQQAARHDH